MKKFEFIKAMNTIVTSLNDEKAYGEWITIVPDEATDDDFEYIANDNQLFEDAICIFKEIMDAYADDGFFIDNRLYG